MGQNEVLEETQRRAEVLVLVMGGGLIDGLLLLAFTMTLEPFLLVE